MIKDSYTIICKTDDIAKTLFEKVKAYLLDKGYKAYGGGGFGSYVLWTVEKSFCISFTDYPKSEFEGDEYKGYVLDEEDVVKYLEENHA